MSDNELNRRIAKLRHECAHWPMYEALEIIAAKDEAESESYPPPYDTLWEACGPLLEELPCVGLYHGHKTDSTWGVAWDNPSDHQINGVGTAQRAIALAWLAWKEEPK